MADNQGDVPKCSGCNSASDVVKIVYGEPRPDSNVLDLARQGLIKHGGCCPPPDGIFRSFHCKKCKKDF